MCEANDLAFHLPAAHAGHLAWSVWSGRLDQSRRHARRAVELSRQVGRPAWEAAGLTGLGAVAVLQGDHGRAQDWLSGRRRCCGPEPWRDLSTGCGCVTGWLCRPTHPAIWNCSGHGGGDRADRPVAAAAGTSDWRVAAGRARTARGATTRREHIWRRAAHCRPTQRALAAGSVVAGPGGAGQGGRRPRRGVELAHDSLEVLDDYGDRVGAAAALEMIADLAVALGEPERSLRLLAASQRFHTDTGIARFPLQADRFDRPQYGTGRTGPHRRDRMLGRRRPAVARRGGRLCPPRAGRASTPADRLGVTDSRRTRRRATGRRRPHQRRDRATPVHLRQHGQEAPVPRLRQGGRGRTRGSRRTGCSSRPVVPPGRRNVPVG